MIRFTDSAKIGSVRDTQDGYLVAVSRVARTGVQDYLASELGLPGNRIVKVNRSADNVFSKDAMGSLTHAPVTVDHPSVSVSKDNWRDLAVGEVGADVMRDGDWLSVPLIVKDAKGVDAARTTHREISMGYSANIVDAPAGSGYDYEMTDIRFNHLALVPKGRAGYEARIGDADNWGAAPQPQKEPIHMDMTTIVVGDKAVQVAASDADVITKIVADHAAIVEAKDTLIGELKAECADATSKVLSDADIEARVEQRMAVVDKATKLVDGLDAKGKSVADVKREAVRGVYGDEAAGTDVTDAEINGIFRVMQPKTVNDSARDLIKDKTNIAVKDADAKIADAINARFNKDAK